MYNQLQRGQSTRKFKRKAQIPRSIIKVQVESGCELTVLEDVAPGWCAYLCPTPVLKEQRREKTEQVGCNSVCQLNHDLPSLCRWLENTNSGNLTSSRQDLKNWSPDRQND